MGLRHACHSRSMQLAHVVFSTTHLVVKHVKTHESDMQALQCTLWFLHSTLRQQLHGGGLAFPLCVLASGCVHRGALRGQGMRRLQLPFDPIVRSLCNSHTLLSRKLTHSVTQDGSTTIEQTS